MGVRVLEITRLTPTDYAEREAPGDHLRPRFLVPFKVQAADCQERARAWLGRGWYHPRALAASAAVQPFSGVYLPFWTFSADRAKTK